jgi:hypothetical protein
VDQPKVTLTNHIAPIHCPQCDEKAYIIRRTTDAAKDDGSEVWTFQCVTAPRAQYEDFFLALFFLATARPAPAAGRPFLFSSFSF